MLTCFFLDAVGLLFLHGVNLLALDDLNWLRLAGGSLGGFRGSRRCLGEFDRFGVRDRDDNFDRLAPVLLLVNAPG